MNNLHHARYFRRKFLCISVLVLIFTAVSSPAAQEAVEWNNKGVQYLKERNYPEAVAAFSKAVEIDADLSIGWYHLGLARYRSDQPEQAIEDFNRAIGLKPGDADAHVSRGNAYFKLNKPDAAVKDYSEAIRLRPDDAYAYASRGLTYSRMERYEQAIDDFSKAIEINPDAAADYFNRGVTYQNMGRNAQALADYTAVIKLKPDHAKAFFYRSEVHEALGNSAASYADAEAAAGLAPDNRAYADRMNSLKRVADGSPMKKKTARAAPEKKPASVKTAEAEIYHTEGGYGDVAGYLCRRAAKDYESWKQSRQAVYFHNALFHINSAISMDPGKSEYWFVQGMLYAALKADPLYMAVATDSLLRAVEINPGHGRAQFLLAQVLQEQDKFGLAAERYRFLIGKDGNMATGLVLGPLALCFIADGRVDEGVGYFEALSSRYPESAAVKTALAVLMKNNNQRGLAKKQLEQVIEKKIGLEAEQKYARDLIAEWNKGGNG
jgi:tetratricopeptide (TPR) repeat protein